jgi:aspartyl/glutamyl-tRNA(Asn/Gln) amidotransferase C subunit
MLSMSTITKEKLQHLAKLTSLQLSDDELEKMLPQMEQIIQFVWKLQEVELDSTETCDDDCVLETREWVATPMDHEIFMNNVKHPITNGMITIQTSTNQKK